MQVNTRVILPHQCFYYLPKRNNTNKTTSISCQTCSGVTDQAGQSQRGAVALAHEESLKDDLVEGSICTASQESVQLSKNQKHTVTTC